MIHDLTPRLEEMKKTWINTAREQRESLDPEFARTLQSLGYLGTGPSSAQPQTPLQVSPLRGLSVKYRECFSGEWGRYAADTYDGLFPVRIAAAGGDLFVISNTTRDLSRLISTAGRVREAAPNGVEYEEVWFQRRKYELAPQSQTLLALLDGRTLLRYFANPEDYRRDEDGNVFTQPVAHLDREFVDLLDAGSGIILFTKDAVYIRHGDGRIALLGQYATDATRTAVNGSTVYIGAGQTILRLREGRAVEVVAKVPTQILSLALRGNEIWVGTEPFPYTPPADKNPILIYDAATGRQTGAFGSRLLHPTENFWSEVDVGPFGIAFPKQIVFNGDRLYILDSGLERILSYDVY